MLVTPLVQIIMKHARYVGLGALVAVLPIAARASIITETIDFTVDGINGDLTFTVDENPLDPSHSTSDGAGNYADPNDGLLSLSMQYNSVNYTMADFLDFPFMPIVLLPGNGDLQHGLQYELIGAVVVDGSCTGSAGFFNCTGAPPSDEATILAFGPKVQSYYVSSVATVDASVSGSSSQLVLTGNGITAIAGSITGESAVPEPALVPVMALTLAGLLFARRRKVAQ